MPVHTILQRLTVLLLLALPAAAQNSTSYIGASHATHQLHFDNLTPQGYRMVSLTVAGDYNNARYSAVWHQVGGPPWGSVHGLNYTQYQTQVTSWETQGWRAKLVAATGTYPNTVFAAVWVLDGADAHHIQSTSQFDTRISTQRSQGRFLSSCAVYTVNGVTHHALVFEPNPDKIAWGAQAGDDGATFGHKFNEFALGHARLNVMATSASQLYTHAWRDDRIGTWQVVAGRTAAEFISDRNLLEGQGLILTCIAASGTGSAARYGGIFQQRLIPYSRSITRTGQVVPGMTSFNVGVENLMVAKNIRNASLAVARHGRLIYARGYTYAEPGSFITQPTTPFRLGSISKPLTGTLIHELIERNIGGFTLGTMPVHYLGITNYSPGATNASVRRMLRHISGFTNVVSEQQARQWWIDNHGPGFLPMPLDESIIIQYGYTLPFTPVNEYKYSNVAYTTLGQVIEQATGQTYMNALRDRLFAPVDTTALYQQRPRPQNHAPGEAPYFLPAVTLEPSNIYSDFRELTNQYAREYWDSAGGTVSSSIVLARAIAGAFSIGNASPTLLPGARERALERFTYGTRNLTGGGWFWSDLGGDRYLYTHDGAVDGFGARIAFTSDGLCIVLLTNMTNAASSGEDLVAMADEVTNWPQHDLFPSYGMPTFPNDVQVGTPYCFGDGSGASCPCGNSGSAGHGCRNRVFSQGAELNAVGTNASISNDTVVMRVSRTTPNQPGLFFQGTIATNGGSGVVFGDGLRCAGGSVVRLQVRTASFLGFTSTTISIPTAGGVSPGETRRYQWWYRDPGASPCGTEFNLSNGWTITWAP